MLRGGDGLRGVTGIGALEAADKGSAELRDERGVLSIGLIAAAPTRVAHYRDARGEGPRDTGRGCFDRGGAPDSLDEVRVSRGPEADVMREYRRVLQGIVSVHGVDSVDDRDLKPGGKRRVLERVDHGAPTLARVVGWGRAAAAQYAAETEAPDLVGRKPVHRELGHLPNLLAQGHALQQVLNAVLDGGIRFPVEGVGRRTIAGNRHDGAPLGQGVLRILQEREIILAKDIDVFGVS